MMALTTAGDVLMNRQVYPVRNMCYQHNHSSGEALTIQFKERLAITINSVTVISVTVSFCSISQFIKHMTKYVDTRNLHQ